MTPTKRILLAILLIVIAVSAGVGIYFVFFRAPVVPRPIAPVNAPPITGLPTAPTGAPPGAPAIVPSPLPEIPKIAQGGPTQTTQLTTTSVKNVTLSGDGRAAAYYDQTDGRFYRVSPDGTVAKLSGKQFFNVDKVTWAPGASRAVLEYPDGANIMYDFTADKQVTLPKHWEDFSFSPNGDQIVSKSIGVNPDNRWLIVSSADGSQAQAIEPLGDNADKVISSWSPNDQVIAFSDTATEGRGFDTQEIYLVGKNHENFKSLIVEGQDFRPLWSSDGKQLLYSVYNSQNGYRPQLWISGAQGNDIGANRHSISLNTWADKCTFTDSTTVYCAVPTSLPEGAGLQPPLFRDIPDQIFKVDITTGAKTMIGAPSEGSSISTLMVSTDGQFLTYTDANGILRQMQLR